MEFECFHLSAIVSSAYSPWAMVFGRWSVWSMLKVAFALGLT